MMNDESTESTTDVSIVGKFQLLIDGCNGPIRFRERNLRCDRDGYSDDATTAENDNGDNDNVILSFLRPDSIFEETHNNYYKKTFSTKSSKQTKKKTKKKNSGSADSSSTSNTSRCPNWNDPERLDMIPLLKKLLKMNHNNNNSNETENDDNDSSSSLFHSVSVIFDGISMTKRPSIPIPLSLSIPPPEDGVVGKSSQQDNDDNVEERERIWLMQNNNNHNSAILLLARTEAGGENDDSNNNDNDNDNANESSIYSSSRNSSDRGTIKIEITGLYDEADNIIVDRIVQLQKKQHQQQQQQRLLARNRSRRRILSSSSSLKTTSRTDTNTQHQNNQKQTQIQILHRTKQGPGKNRCLLQSIGLLRSESVACIFENPTFGRLTKDGQKTIKSLQRNRLLSSKQGMIDIETTTISHPQMTYDIKEDSYEEKKEEEDHRTSMNKQKDDNNAVIIVPIVVTDDVFLRQRIIEDTTYYVMTFHQLWHMLMDVKNT
ncbi:hypothetical protein FRACYDRAFT_249081 [Fragilariopsis cylindrus CCMP1102]|uniref:Uncharacterized protein n=1 Tax=Fragilariopsis cylindrus CCMP1102 TaxID=635003 RepID=A0A1E7EUD8_9STRA|nr:hypothetical protein FRACYDRAFT_249081 [Fragilariopsis cylindrus CCMP1102]|eukprot:OEU09163.1 hypothetical protein FRACYDRAFT_249081 [Fragilariopsis cylindrus CCMP1102]